MITINLVTVYVLYSKVACWVKPQVCFPEHKCKRFTISLTLLS